MARGTRGRRRLASRQYRFMPYPLPSCGREDLEKEVNTKNITKALDEKDWEDATCSVCMEFPHNAVLLLCSSHDKGCRPYMCGTSYRYSNCLDQFKKAYTKVMSPRHVQARVQDSPWDAPVENTIFDLGSVWPSEQQEVAELACPLCRGQVKGWTVVEAAREYLNAKKRSCMQDDCSFVGTYKELRKHVRAEHLSARPREVDPILEQTWRRLEYERERDDVLSTIRSSMPGAMVLGDYVIEGGLHNHHRHHHDFNTDDDDDDDGGEIEDVDYETSIGGHNWFNFFFIWSAINSTRSNASFSSRLRRQRDWSFRTAGQEGSSSGVPPIAAAGVTVSATSEGDDESPAGGERVVGVGRSERRRRSRSQ